jgi:polysaccharide export outer membrane protein
VFGEVQRPGAQLIGAESSLLEAISAAGGFTVEAARSNVLLLRGGLAEPTVYKVNARKIFHGEFHHNLALLPGDIIYVPSSLFADVTRIFSRLSAILAPFVLAESGIVLGPDVY